MKTTVKRTKKTAEARYALRKGLGFWELTFAGQHAVFKHEQGAYYVAYLLLNPPEEPIHGMVLGLRTAAIYGRPVGATEIVDPLTGKKLLVESEATIEQRSLGLDDAEAAWALRRKQLMLETLLEDEDQIGPVKAEAFQELQEIYDFQERNAWRTKSTAQKAADTVGKALKRFYRHLDGSEDEAGGPHPVLRAFAAHLKQYLLVPSGRCCSRGGPRPGEGMAGCFVYRPPQNAVWANKM